MKKHLIIMSVCASLTCFAQQQKGDLSIQFSGNYYSQKVKFAGTTYQSSAGNIYIKFGQFFTPNIELGVKPNIRFFLEPSSSDSKKKVVKTNVGFGVYGTYSFLTADGKFMPYGGGEINYIPVGNASTVNLGPYGGVKYFIKENINIDANASYSFTVGNSFGEGSFDPGQLLMINIGVGVILGKLN
jgi:hypothetical protein